MNRLITGNLPIITPRRGSGVNNPLNNPTGFRLNPCEISEDPPDERMGASSPLSFWIRTGAPRQVPSHVARRGPGPRQWPVKWLKYRDRVSDRGTTIA